MKSNLEFRDIISFSPVLLYKSDLYELEKLVLDSRTHKNDTFRITLTYSHKHFEAKSMDQLLQYEDLPQATDQLSIERQGWNSEGKNIVIDRGLNITLCHNYAQCQIHSLDEDWYEGKLSRLKAYFKSKVPWYAFLNKISPAFPTVAILFLFNGLALAKRGNMVFSVAQIVLCILFLIASWLAFRGILFPHVKIVLHDKKKFQVGKNEIIALLGAVASIVTIIQFIMSWISKS